MDALWVEVDEALDDALDSYANYPSRLNQVEVVDVVVSLLESAKSKDVADTTRLHEAETAANDLFNEVRRLNELVREQELVIFDLKSTDNEEWTEPVAANDELLKTIKTLTNENREIRARYSEVTAKNQTLQGNLEENLKLRRVIGALRDIIETEENINDLADELEAALEARSAANEKYQAAIEDLDI